MIDKQMSKLFWNVSEVGSGPTNLEELLSFGGILPHTVTHGWDDLSKQYHQPYITSEHVFVCMYVRRWAD